MTAKRRRTLPPVSPKVAAELRPLVTAIAEIIETGEGVRGDPLDRKLTLRDLLDSGIGRLRPGASLSGPGGLQPGSGVPDLSTPPQPVGFEAVAAFDGEVFLTWDAPQGLYGNHALTNIYRAESDNFANAVRIGQEPGMFYIDNVRADTAQKTYYYWITFTSTSDVEGPTNATAGTPVTTILSPEYIIEQIAGLIGESELANELLTPIQSIPTIQQTLDDHGLRIPSLETTVGNHAIQLPTMQGLLDDYGPRIAAAEGELVDHNNQFTNLGASLANAELDIIANADAYASLDTRVVATETSLSAQAGEITALQTTLNDLTVSAFDANTNYAIGELFRHDNVVYEVVATQTPPNATPPNATYYTARPDYETLADTVSANSAAVAALDTRVTQTENDITAQATDITLLESDMATAQGDITANANANSALSTRVTTAENNITAASGDITTLQNSLATTDGNVTTNANAIQSLQTDVSSINGVITSHSTDITQLQNDLTATNGNVTANAGAISSLDTRVTAAEGDISSQSTQLTSLTNSLAITDGNVTANADALQLLDNRVVQTEDTLVAHNSSLTQLRTDVDNLDVDGNAQALNQLTTRVETNEQDILATAQNVTSLSTTVGDHTSALQQKAEVQVVTDLQGEVQSIQSKYTLKLDVDGYVAGIGLMNDGATSELVVASDAVYFIDRGQSITAFNPQTNYPSMAALRNTQFVFGYAQVEGQKRFAINVPAYIPQLYVEAGMLKDLTVTRAKIANLAVNGAKIDIADIWELNIGNEVRSVPFTSGSQGWRIAKDGTAEFNNVTVRGHVEMETGYISDQVQIGGVVQYRSFAPGNFIRNGQATLSYSVGMTNAHYLNDGVRAISGNYWELPAGVQYLQADLGEEIFVSESRMFFYALDGRKYYMAVSVSSDGVTWEYVLGSGPADGGPATGFEFSRVEFGGYQAGFEFPTITPIGKFTRYVRVWMNGSTANAGNHGYEWELYGAGGGGEDPYVSHVGKRSNEWTRAGSTLINGNKIYTGDAYVDTLQIKGNAVTVPLQAKNPSWYIPPRPSGGGWATLVSLRVRHYQSGNFPVLLVFGCKGFTYNNNNPTTWSVRVMYGSTQLGYIAFDVPDSAASAYYETTSLLEHLPDNALVRIEVHRNSFNDIHRYIAFIAGIGLRR
ncbi:hypothetical protein [Marinobacter sp. MDS2]|uniref:phage tail tip fiber protein n=1 Tax=Marinobacter sp. MDS2 TaxID=3065961 RepID=UPI00273CE831|nr:hypothetical protein [Marinobacter sp. MDS2]MDP4546484.1 hypothetical protein [Marinobacter sp. MDS2]